MLFSFVSTLHEFKVSIDLGNIEDFCNFFNSFRYNFKSPIIVIAASSWILSGTFTNSENNNSNNGAKKQRNWQNLIQTSDEKIRQALKGTNVKIRTA